MPISKFRIVNQMTYSIRMLFGINCRLSQSSDANSYEKGHENASFREVHLTLVHEIKTKNCEMTYKPFRISIVIN
jgi:hypothetical protein